MTLRIMETMNEQAKVWPATTTAVGSDLESSLPLAEQQKVVNNIAGERVDVATSRRRYCRP